MANNRNMAHINIQNGNAGLNLNVLDNPEIHELTQALPQAKRMLTRRTHDFCALLNGRQPYTRQALVTARENMMAACGNMVVELDNYVHMGLNQEHQSYLDGRRRQEECEGHYREVYEARLADFIERDSLAESASSVASQHLSCPLSDKYSCGCRPPGGSGTSEPEGSPGFASTATSSATRA